MIDTKYYDGSRLVNSKDLNKKKPELYMVSGNRSAGKTTWFNKFMLDQYIKGNGKFALLYRFNYELEDVPDKFFKDIGRLFFQGAEFTSKARMKSTYQELFFEGESCGYALSLNTAESIKKMSHLLSDTARGFLDEFQSETNTYCPREIQKFISIHTSLARGNGEQVRYVPFYLCSNCVTMLNPYYSALGISSRLQKDTKYLRGDGFVLEQTLNLSAMKAQHESAFNRAFKDNSYVSYGAENVYLNDDVSFIEKIRGKSVYTATIKFENKEYGVREFPDKGIVYCDDNPDVSFPIRIVATTEDHSVNYVMLQRHSFFISQMRYYFEKGVFRFKNLQSKDAILRTISYL